MSIPKIWLAFAALWLLWGGCALGLLQLLEWAFGQWSTADLSGATVVAADAPAWLSFWTGLDGLQGLHGAILGFGQWLGQYLPSGTSIMVWVRPLLWLVWGLGAGFLFLVAVVLHITAIRFAAAQPEASSAQPQASA